MAKLGQASMKSPILSFRTTRIRCMLSSSDPSGPDSCFTACGGYFAKGTAFHKRAPYNQANNFLLRGHHADPRHLSRHL